jgi:virginiamycin A acetyltransferase
VGRDDGRRDVRAESRRYGVGHDVWLGYSAPVLPGVEIGHVVRARYSDEDVTRLLRAAWWNWPIDLVTEHVRTNMSGTAAEIEDIAVERGVAVR